MLAGAAIARGAESATTQIEASTQGSRKLQLTWELCALPDIQDPNGALGLVDDVEEAIGLDDDLTHGQGRILSGLRAEHGKVPQTSKRGFGFVEEMQRSEGILLSKVREHGGVALRRSLGVSNLHRDDGKNLARSRAETTSKSSPTPA